MKLFKTLAVALGIAALSTSTIGCGDACDAATSHSEDCGVDVSNVDTEVECTDKRAAVAECWVDLSCDQVNPPPPGDPAAAAAAAACLAATP